MNRFGILLASLFIVGCNQQAEPSASNQAGQEDYPDSVYEFLAIPKDGKLSAASKRALERNFAQNDDWICDLSRDVHDPEMKGHNNLWRPEDYYRWGLSENQRQRIEADNQTWIKNEE